MKCTACGNDIDDEDRQCPYCGAEVMPFDGEAGKEPSLDIDLGEVFRKFCWPLFVVAGILLVVVGLAVLGIHCITIR